MATLRPTSNPTASTTERSAFEFEPATVTHSQVDPAGRFWAGSMDRDGDNYLNKGALYVLDIDGKTRKMYSPVSVSNGICWTKDAQTM